MTFADKLWDVLMKARARHPEQKLSEIDWKRNVNETAAAHFKRRKPQSVLERDKCVEALALATGTKNVEQITEPEFKTLRKALRDIRKVSGSLNDVELIAELGRRSALYRDRHPTWPLTPMSLTKYWSHFGRMAGAPTVKETGEPSVPWRDAMKVAAEMTEDPSARQSRLTAWEENYQWVQLGPDFRKKINEVLNAKASS